MSVSYMSVSDSLSLGPLLNDSTELCIALWHSPNPVQQENS